MVPAQQDQAASDPWIQTAAAFSQIRHSTHKLEVSVFFDVRIERQPGFGIHWTARLI